MARMAVLARAVDRDGRHRHWRRTLSTRQDHAGREKNNKCGKECREEWSVLQQFAKSFQPFHSALRFPIRFQS